MKFGKQLQAELIPGWSEYYLDYKFLKKIVSSLASNRPASEAAALALGIRVRPADLLAQSTSDAQTATPAPSPHQSVENVALMSVDEPPLVDQDDDYRGPDFQAHKAAFFFKLERELEKINAFYLRKEAELKLRLETLLSKRRAAASRVLPDGVDDTTQNYVEWKAVEEGFRLLERDLAKLQRFIEMNATGFRKILKKWDKRSKSTTKELYLARQVDVQPVFNRQLIGELSDTVAAVLVDITDLSVGAGQGDDVVNERVLSQQFSADGGIQMALFRDLENNLRKAVAANDTDTVRQLVLYSNTLERSPVTAAPTAVNTGPALASANVTRVLWKTVVDAPPHLADLILATATSFDWRFIDDINGRTLLHEASIAGAQRLVDLCISSGLKADAVDAYGRSALHYAAMHGHSEVALRLLQAKSPANARDVESYSPLVYATLRGSVDCVRVLLVEGGVQAHPTPPDDAGDLIPLALASLAGHLDVVLLLLESGAKSVPNSNGEYPIHFAARQGHTDIVRLLASHDGWDVPDKYYEWTPLFHAARFGHADCVRVLLDSGARTDTRDELGHNALHYACWYGHTPCVELLRARAFTPVSEPAQPVLDSPDARSTGSSALRATESDMDLIPSLTLPPPMMPHRVYGHNYLDRQTLVQITIGRAQASHSSLPGQPASAVRLHPKLMGGVSADDKTSALLSAPLLKLVMTAAPTSASAPYSVALPLSADDVHVFAFQTTAIGQLALEFSLYPNFGTKTIGRAIVPPELVNAVRKTEVVTLPILDTRLHIIGEITFEILIITPFQKVTLEIGGAVETYWKSLGSSKPSPPPPNRRPAPSPAPARLNRPIRGMPASAQASPSGFVPQPTSTGPSQTITVTSVMGSYLQLVVHVTRDLHPVFCTEAYLPGTGFDLRVEDVTRAQFEALATKTGRTLADVPSGSRSSPVEWHKVLSGKMVALDTLLAMLPGSIWFFLDLAFSGSSNGPAFNEAVDAILRVVYRAYTPSDARRKIIFGSAVPDVCMAINWKQPNYPVLYVSCKGSPSPSPRDDRRLASLDAAVEFARGNNLLGVLVQGELLATASSLANAVREAGLLVGACCTDYSALPTLEGDATPDAVVHNGVLNFHDPLGRL
ncbi:unnamed protein product [Peniophora sp. CBMAI 1063]|nr:unnamed protein product [Peniophora sp. CBMAI 1063]